MKFCHTLWVPIRNLTRLLPPEITAAPYYLSFVPGDRSQFSSRFRGGKSEENLEKEEDFKEAEPEIIKIEDLEDKSNKEKV